MPDVNQHVLQYVDAYVHDALEAADEAVVRAHISQCRICQVACEEAEQRQQLMQNLPVLEASDELVRKVEDHIDRHERRPRLRKAADGFANLPHAAKVLVVSIAVAVTLVFVQLYFVTREPTPYDLRVYGQTELLAGSPSSLRVVVYDHAKQSFLEDVPVAITLSRAEPAESIQLISFRTDRFGTGRAHFDLPKWDDGDYELRIVAQPGGEDEIVVRRVSLKRSWQVMLSSDKPVYQPGQTIRLRSLALRQPDQKPVAGRRATFSIRDPRGNLIFKQADVTSRFGISSADCPLAAEIREGAYEIECRIDDTVSCRTVEVKHYVLPKFKIDTSLDRSFYQPGDVVRGTLSARYFFGKPVAGGEYKVTTRFDGSEGPFTGRTDDEGSARFEFRLPEEMAGRPELSGDAKMELELQVRDSAGQTQSTTLTRLVSSEPIHIDVVPESGKLVRDVSNRVYFLTSYPDGRPAKVRLALTSFEQEFQTSQFGVATVDVVPKSESIHWLCRATDDEGLTGRRDIELQCGQNASDFVLRVDRPFCESGETIHFVALGGGAEPVFLDLIKNGQTLLTDSFDVDDGRGEYAFDLPPDLFGTVTVCGYRFDPNGFAVRKFQTLQIRQSGDVQIAASLDKKEYRPGEAATIDFRLTDRRGRPVPGALSLAAVDEAVYSVTGARPGLEETFFALDTQLLQPIVTQYPDALDDTPETDDRDEFERAVFAMASEPVQKDRDAVIEELLPFVDNSARVFEVLERDDWQTLLGRDDESTRRMNQLLSEGNGVHDLQVATYPTKERLAERARQSYEETFTKIWLTFFGIVFSFFLITILVRVRIVEVAVTILIILALFALLIPGVQQAREASRRTEAVNNLKQIELAIHNLRDARGAFPGENLSTEASPTSPPRVRQWFPETLLWRPELITDNEGRASLTVDLADSITTWQLSASAVTSPGRLGADTIPIRVFQPFFIDVNAPVALTRNDEVSLPVVVYNYLDKPQSVELSFADADWLELLDEPKRTLELAAGEVRSLNFRLRAVKSGTHEFEISGIGNGVGDAVRRSIDVHPDGRRIEATASGILSPSQTVEISRPADATEGSERVLLHLYPSTFSQLVEGLDTIFQQPYGCFEQTSSTTYPNVLALDYLRRTKTARPAVEAKARQYIHLGYQRLLGFEISNGGFDWFGNPPANVTLTAYGLMEFEDMAEVYDVDPELIRRTRDWLLQKQASDGRWPAESHALHDDPTRRGNGNPTLSTTAYVAWSVFRHGTDSVARERAGSYLTSYRPDEIDNPYQLALVANALLAIDGNAASARPYLERMLSLREENGDGKLVWWQPQKLRSTVFYGSGTAGNIETTALAVLALLESGRSPDIVKKALTWISSQRDARGLWHSTQATVLALKSLLAASGRPLGGDRSRKVRIEVDGQSVQELDIPADQSDVVQSFDLTTWIAPGRHSVTLTDRTDAATVFQMTTRYYVSEGKSVPTDPSGPEEPMSIALTYDKTDLSVDETIQATAIVRNHQQEAAPMLLIQLPVPAGFEVLADEFERLREQGAIAKYEISAREVTVYVRGLPAGDELKLEYQLRAVFPVKVKTSSGLVYEYYDPQLRAEASPVRLTVR